jgi:hypothetical protein
MRTTVPLILRARDGSWGYWARDVFIIHGRPVYANTSYWEGGIGPERAKHLGDIDSYEYW